LKNRIKNLFIPIITPTTFHYGKMNLFRNVSNRKHLPVMLHAVVKLPSFIMETYILVLLISTKPKELHPLLRRCNYPKEMNCVTVVPGKNTNVVVYPKLNVCLVVYIITNNTTNMIIYFIPIISGFLITDLFFLLIRLQSQKIDKYPIIHNHYQDLSSNNNQGDRARFPLYLFFVKDAVAIVIAFINKSNSQLS
jgi:hypothetical protein